METYSFSVDVMFSLRTDLFRSSFKFKYDKAKSSALMGLPVEHYLRAHHTPEAFEIRPELRWSRKIQW